MHFEVRNTTGLLMNTMNLLIGYASRVLGIDCLVGTLVVLVGISLFCFIAVFFLKCRVIFLLRKQEGFLLPPIVVGHSRILTRKAGLSLIVMPLTTPFYLEEGRCNHAMLLKHGFNCASKLFIFGGQTETGSKTILATMHPTPSVCSGIPWVKLLRTRKKLQKSSGCSPQFLDSSIINAT